jgi:hypothetical protein
MTKTICCTSHFLPSGLLYVPHLHAGGAPILVAPTRLVLAAAVRISLIAVSAVARRAVLPPQQSVRKRTLEIRKASADCLCTYWDSPYPDRRCPNAASLSGRRLDTWWRNGRCRPTAGSAPARPAAGGRGSPTQRCGRRTAQGGLASQASCQNRPANRTQRWVLNGEELLNVQVFASTAQHAVILHGPDA